MEKEIEAYFDRLWPICRSITGNGLRQSLKIIRELIPLAGIGYIQAFWAKNKVFPFIGLSYVFVMDTNEFSFLLMFGLNLRLGNTEPT